MIPAGWPRAGAAAALAVAMAATHGAVCAAEPALPRPVGTTTAQVEFVQGHATRLSPALAAGPARSQRPAPADSASPLRAGDTVTEGTRLQVPKDGYLRLRLADGSVVRVLADSDVELKRLRGKRPGRPSQSVIELRKGKVEADVAPQPKGRMFEVQAPGAVASVRGTRFDVAVGSDARVLTAVTAGMVRLQPRGGAARPATADLAAGQGAVIDGQGRMSPQRALPAAPQLSQRPFECEDLDHTRLQLAPLNGAVGGYQVRIARDPRFREVVRNGVFQTAQVAFGTLEDGDYTVGVRALDADGLAGAESRSTLQVRAHRAAAIRAGARGEPVSTPGAPIERR